MSMHPHDDLELRQRMTEIARRVAPCPAPDVAAGWDLCAHEVPWPCPITEAAWIARGLDREQQIRSYLSALAPTHPHENAAQQ